MPLKRGRTQYTMDALKHKIKRGYIDVTLEKAQRQVKGKPSLRQIARGKLARQTKPQRAVSPFASVKSRAEKKSG